MATYANGKIPLSFLRKVGCFVPVAGAPAQGAYLQAEAQRQATALQNAFFLKFHKPLNLSEGYRDFANQQWRRNLYIRAGGALAAVPGTSVHGWALAADWGSGVETYGSAEKIWMDANAPKYGWKPTGNGFKSREAWHFEYVGGAIYIAAMGIKLLTKLPVITTPASVTHPTLLPTSKIEGNYTDMFAVTIISASKAPHVGLVKGVKFILDTREKTLTRVDNNDKATPAQLQTLKDEYNTYAYVQPDGKALNWSGDTAWRYVDGGYTRKGW